MAINATFAGDLLNLLFEGTTIANIAVNATSGPLTDLYLSAHTADPVAGNQSTSEAAYTDYARVAVARTGSGWTVTGAEATNDAEIAFPECTGSSSTITHIGLGTASSGTGKLLWSAAVSSPGGGLAVSTGITPTIAAGAVTFTIGS